MRLRKSNLIILAALALAAVGIIYISTFAHSLDIETHSQRISGVYRDLGGDTLVIITPGSGPTDRDGNSPLLSGHNDSLRLLAKGLEQQGISTYRYDKQDGEHTPVFEVMIQDLVDIIGYFRDKGTARIVLAGHSQGALVAALAAEQTPVEGVVSICGAGQSIGQVLADQLQMDSIDPILEKVSRGESLEDEPDGIQMIFSDRNAQFLLSWMAYDPAETVRSLETDLLLIGGTMDRQVPPAELALLSDASPASRTVLIDGMNHVLKIVETEEEDLASYTSPDYPISDILIEEIATFVLN